jgi:hypothetical protein
MERAGPTQPASRTTLPSTSRVILFFMRMLISRDDRGVNASLFPKEFILRDKYIKIFAVRWLLLINFDKRPFA